MPECLQDGKLGRKKKKLPKQKKKKKHQRCGCQGELELSENNSHIKAGETDKHGYISTCFESYNHEDDVLMKQNSERQDSEAQEVGENVQLQS